MAPPTPRARAITGPCLASPPPLRPSRVATVAVLLSADVVAAVVSVLAARVLAGLSGSELPPDIVLGALVFILLAPLTFRVAGLYPAVGMSGAVEARRAAFGSAFASVGLVPFLVAPGDVAGVAYAALVAATAWITVPLARAIARDLACHRSWWGVPLVLLGAGPRAADLVRDLLERDKEILRPVAAFDDDPQWHGTHLHGVPVLGRLVDAEQYAEAGVRHALVAGSDEGAAGDAAPLAGPRLPFASLIWMHDGAVATGPAPRPIVLAGRRGFEWRQPRFVATNLHAKRLFDLLLLVPAGLMAFPIVGIAALLVRALDPGDPFFVQERIGVGGQRFKVIKLRTMYQDAEERLAHYLDENPEAREEWRRSYKLRKDTRILPGIGHFLRMSSLDELPQLWNIAKGEMSFVGPRPFPRYHMEAFDDEFRALRQEVMPGLTGLWQITARADSDLEIQRRLDTEYIETWSVWQDLRILARTPAAVLLAKGAR